MIVICGIEVFSMLGITYAIIVSIGSFFYTVKNNNENEKNKEKYRHPNGMTYIDIKGRSKLISNNELVFYTHDKNGDYILEDASGNVYRNFSKEERKQRLNERKKNSQNNNETTYCIDDDKHQNDWICKGKRFKDFQTGDIYVVRCINYKYYYMNISNGMVVRKTDWQIKQEDKKTYLKDLDIDSFNRNQGRITNKQLLYRNFDYNYFCDRYK